MKKKDVLTITTVALGTAALTVVTFWSGPIDAGTDPEGPAVKIVQPKCITGGMEWSLNYPGKQQIKVGDQPQFELTAVNLSKERKTANICVVMTGTAPASPFARTITMPSVIWQHDRTLTLNAGEKRSITLPATSSIPGNQLISVQLAENKKNTAGAPDLTPLSTFTLPELAPRAVVAFTFSTITNETSSLRLARAK
jgi:hypothetical protein